MKTKIEIPPMVRGAISTLILSVIFLSLSVPDIVQGYKTYRQHDANVESCLETICLPNDSNRSERFTQLLKEQNCAWNAYNMLTREQQYEYELFRSSTPLFMLAMVLIFATIILGGLEISKRRALTKAVQ